jgi:hypothetical protein
MKMKTLIAITLLAAGSAWADLASRVAELEDKLSPRSYGGVAPSPEEVQRAKDFWKKQEEEELRATGQLKWWIEFHRHTSIPTVSHPVANDQ